MGKLKRMDQVRMILQTYKETGPIKGTARRLQVSKNTVREYIRRWKDCKEDFSQVFALTDTELWQVIHADVEEGSGNREGIFMDLIDYWVKELRRVGVTKKLLWEEYRKEHSGGYGYSQFCERLNCYGNTKITQHQASKFV